MDSITIGVIGCGSISQAYLKGAARSDLLEVKAVADINADAAAERASAYDTEAVSVEALLADPDIQMIINLTVPLVHAEISLAILEAGKHAYSEKPLAAKFADGKALLAAAAEKGLRVGCAPDTFLGAGHQACRQAIDEGVIGEVVGGVGSILTHGMEHWHPNPAFFFQPGGGPVLDMGPYYITQLVNLIGPVKRVTAITSMASPTRTVTSDGPMTGQQIKVEVPTSVNGVLAFANGANVSLSASWDVWNHQRLPNEIYGSKGSMLCPDPNFFGGRPMVSEERGDWRELDISAYAYGVPNRKNGKGEDVADYRIIGLLDMAAAIQAGREHRAGGAMALHVLEVMEALGRSSEEGRHIDIETGVDRPEALPTGKGEEVFL